MILRVSAVKTGIEFVEELKAVSAEFSKISFAEVSDAIEEKDDVDR
jgi:basic membrane lipoprotein Med (substrate-binding protein (PBP1-ABC) superfamily)